jgi:hypothetical protein
MSPELLGVIIGGAIGSLSSFVGLFINHWLEIRRFRYQLKLEAEKEFRKKLTDGVSPNIYDQGMEKLFKMIDEGKIPRSYAMDPKIIDDLLNEIIDDSNN